MAKKSTKQALAIGGTVAALAAAAAGVYFMTGKNAKNRKKVVKWFDGMQKDVLKQLKNAKQTTKAAYNKVVDEVARDYKNLKNVSASDLAVASAELKQHWDAIKSQMQDASSTVKKVVKAVKVTKKASKKKPVKVTKKVSKKSKR